MAKVAPCVVQIETQGGVDMVRAAGPRGGMIRRGLGPTSGLIVGADGYIISSAFNFANKPTTIDVSIPGRKQRYPAKVIATDQTRMLTLLKIEVAGLPVPTPAPKAELKIGQTALAVGRTLPDTVDESPSVSVGIISALGRIWGKAVQTDAKVSPANYGGPLIDLLGRVQGVIVPASPYAEGQTAGFEMYDSGLGFAIPLEDINAILPRLKSGTDLKRGILGVTIQGQDPYTTKPVVTTVEPGSAADKAGVHPGDRITEIDGQPIETQVQLQTRLGTKYEGDVISCQNRARRRGDQPAGRDAGAARWRRSARRSWASCRCATIRVRASKCAGSIRTVRRTRPASRSATASSASTVRRCPASRPASSRSSTATASSTSWPACGRGRT